MTDTSNMPSYVSHKKVRALEIANVGDYKNGKEGWLVRTTIFLDGSVRDLHEQIFRRYMPVPGDFYVVYEDGYESFSPRQQFLDGYTAEGQSFTDIKQEIKRGG